MINSRNGDQDISAFYTNNGGSNNNDDKRKINADNHKEKNGEGRPSTIMLRAIIVTPPKTILCKAGMKKDHFGKCRNVW
jgi:hypothetical protein